LGLLPAGQDQPLGHLGHQLGEVFRVRLHDLVKLCEFAWSEEDLGETEAEVVLVEPQRFEKRLKSHKVNLFALVSSQIEYLAEESGVQSGQIGRQVILVHVVELGEGRSRRETLLHQLQDRSHA